MTDLGLKGNRVAVTGAAGGLGRAFARDFANAGARLLIADINSTGLNETKQQLIALGAEVEAVEVDVRSAQSCSQLAEAAQQSFDGLDTLVNNAALYGGLERKPFTDIDETVWDLVMDINVKGLWQITRKLAPLLKANRTRSNTASIINIASATVFSGSSQWMHYVASKGAVIAMTRVMATEMGPDHIRVNALAPGFTLTEASQSLIENAETYGVNRAPMGRNATTEDITGTALYLASGLSGFVTGQTLIIDGGKEYN